MITKDLLEEIGAAYHELELKHAQLSGALFHRIFELESGWYNGHFHRGDEDTWIRESYPIPVLSVMGYCDIEIHFNKISISTKLKRTAALDYSFDKVKAYAFEAYGVEDYLADYYHSGQTIADLKANIKNSGEAEIGFSFTFPFAVEGEKIFEFVKLLRREGFYY